MEVEFEIEALKEFNISTVKFNNKEFIKLHPYCGNILDLFTLPISEFESNIERELIHIKSLFIYLFNKIAETYHKQFLKLQKKESNLDNLKEWVFLEIRHWTEQLLFQFNIQTKNFGDISLYFIEDFLDELFGRIEEINDLFSLIKPYQPINDLPLITFSLDEELIAELEGFGYSEWVNIFRTPVDKKDLIESNIINLKTTSNDKNNLSIIKNITFEEAIKPEAKDEFERWYRIFCIDEPDTNKLDVILFFKLMNNKGYFTEEFDIPLLHQITIDRTKRKISFNYFKNNGRRKFEDWSDGKPNVPIFITH